MRGTYQMTNEGKREQVLQFAQRDEDALEAMSDALLEYREGRWANSGFVSRKREVLAFVRGISDEDLKLLERAVDMIIKGHSFTKQFAVIETFYTRQQSHGNIQLRKGLRLELDGHGWSNPAPGVYKHPFKVMDGKEHLFSIELSDARVVYLLRKGKLAAKA